MGVLACDRNGCEHVMCDYYSPVYGYLCYQCREELKEEGFQDISSFMNRPKSNKDSSYAWVRYVEDIFEER